jgi:hypothetical protein
MGTCIGHEPCPKCRKDGNDRTGNNLARYADGGAYCFSCGYTILPNGLVTLGKETQEDNHAISLPRGVTQVLPERALAWLHKYSLTDHDIKLNNILWSEDSQRIIFPIIISNTLEGWIGRAVDPNIIPKVYTRGKLHESTYIIGNLASRTIILVEDIISAIKVAGTYEYAVSPLFGSHISTRRMLILRRYFDRIIIWLDKDKEKESVKFTKKAQEFGISCRSVITDNDPKEYSHSKILSFLTRS